MPVPKVRPDPEASKTPMRLGDAMPALDQEEFTYSALVNRWRKERSANALSKMDDRFYEAFDAVLRELREEYAKEHAANPATPKVLILQDELMNLQRVRDDIYDLRERKIVTAAVIAARGGNPDRTTMTKEEDILFEEVVAAANEEPRRLGPQRVLVRVKEPVAPFVGTDLRTYRLGVEDVAAVPREIAHALVSRGLASALSG